MVNIMKQVFGVFFAVFLIAMAINTMFAPHHIAAGGVGGIAIIIDYLTHIDMALTAAIFNLAMLITGLLCLGKKMFFKTVYGAILLPILINVIPQVPISHDVLLSVFFGSLMTAIGVNILYYLDASSGGTTVPPLILKKFLGMNPSFGLFISDAIIVTLSLIVFGIEQFMYASLVIMLTSIIMNFLTEGITRRKVVYIISSKQEEIARDLMSIGRGATKLLAQGAYTQASRNVLMVVLNDRDYNKLQKIIDVHDPRALVIVQNVSKVMGEGFSYGSVVR